MNRKYMQSVVKVLPEFSFRNQRFQVKISGCNQADIYFGRFSTAYPLELFFLKHSKQFDLCRGYKISDLIQEQGAAVGQLKTALPPGNSSGESAFLVAEEFAFNN